MNQWWQKIFWMSNTEYSEPSGTLSVERGVGGAHGAFGGNEEGERGRLDPRIEEPSPKGGVGVATGAGDARVANKLAEDMVVREQEACLSQVCSKVINYQI